MERVELRGDGQRVDEASRLHGGLPLITVGIVVLNRSWIIGRTLEALLSQTYPHDRLFVLVVDGGSRDGTAEKAKEVLEGADFAGHEVIVMKCSIPEGRNVCIERMRGECLLFLDSDVLIEPDAILKLYLTMEKTGAAIVTADARHVYVSSIDELAAGWTPSTKGEEGVIYVPAAGMGHTLIRREVFEHVRFDSELTFSEDLDFSVRARERGYRIAMNRGILAFDVNLAGKRSSDIYVSMPLRQALRGLRKKARAKVLSSGFELGPRKALEFYIGQKRFAFYLGYIPVMLLFAYGLLTASAPTLLVLPAYLLLYFLHQLRRRGMGGAANTIARSLLVGLPLSALMLAYFIRYSLAQRRPSQSP
jgi:glycosyltransferase involved in cell wall biosynthesis